ncbi:cation-transporting P-type ATPase [Rhodopirellula maiorica SM1]|uniref:Cation-transporting P-type ATPase n=1 Tax=Rhodopirellula maiorica SM1 TaxID=1265738 RepID=M5S4M4_9BACT|nr:cation-transporting P-type ATPase [Rhodopirellula maiorica]EMI21139.1 cation-transporting P-type ATPase [Rhodopirellula maiorica SM1]
METLNERLWHQTTAEDAVRLLESNADRGLDRFEIEARQQHYGANSLPARSGPGPLIRFLMQFHQPLLYILLTAAVITALLDEWVDASVIFGVVLVNAIIGYLQESKAAKALEALAKTTLTEARVVRSGETQSIASTELVPGDVVLLQSGEKVPADLRLLRSRDLQIDESALTGESVPVQKKAIDLASETPLAERRNMAYASTLVTYGQGRGVVVATAGKTEVGRISELISLADVLETPLTRKIAKFSRVLLVVILVLAAVTFAVGVWRGQAKFEMFMAAVALAVGAIPEGLPAAVTITLAIGVSRMARRRAIIRKLPAVETLGSTTVVCSDKTGTLTVNQMTVLEIWAAGQRLTTSGSGYEPNGKIEVRGDDQTEALALTDVSASHAVRHCLQAGLMCNDSQLVLTESKWAVQGDPTEGALIAVAGKAGLDGKQLETQLPRLDSIPFESQHQYMATLHSNKSDDSRHLYVKGAVEVLLSKCQSAMTPSGENCPLDVAMVQRQVEAMAAEGLRVLAFAGKSLPAETSDISHADVGDLVFYGLQGMIDPPRDEAVAAIKACQTAGIRVKMITGDHAKTAQAIAEQLGLDGMQKSSEEAPIVKTAQDLAESSDQQLIDIADQVAVFARATPELKLRLVRALQAKGHIVAMTGDGVNDAPALKQADIGVAMGIAGTEVAKEAADMVLTDDNFASIKAAVEEGRGVFDNLTKFIVWTLPTNMGEGLVILAAIFVGVALPILPVQILWINMTTAVLLGLMLAFEPKEADIMTRVPRDPQAPILTGELIGRIILVALVMLIGAFGSFEWAIGQGYSEIVARTISVNVFVMVEVFYLFNCRSLTKSMFELGVFTNRWIGFGAAAMLILQIAFTYVPIMNHIFHSAPIGWDAWWRILLTGLATYMIVGLEKWVRRKLRSRTPTGA